MLNLNDIQKRDLHVSHLPTYSKIHTKDLLDNFSTTPCPVCIQPYKVGEYYRELPICGHIFHKRCVDRWLRKDKYRMSCPICRQEYHPEYDL